MPHGEPDVSVVIPTYDRPRHVTRAVASALAQTLGTIEVIVVLDGPLESDRVHTLAGLAAIPDARVRTMVLPVHAGQSAARNAGVSDARGRWIAFLDDDDEWVPDKLEIQLAQARRSVHRRPIIACRLVMRGDRDLVWPRRVPGPTEPISEYLFCRRSLVPGEAMITPSCLFTARELLREVPFREAARRHEDIDWLLRASPLDGVGIDFVSTPRPLTIYHREATHRSLSNRPDWRGSLAWIDRNRALVTPAAYAAFLMTWLTANAVRQGDRKAFWPLITRACRYGAPRAFDVLLCLGILLLPRRARERMASLTAAMLSRQRDSGAAGARQDRAVG